MSGPAATSVDFLQAGTRIGADEIAFHDLTRHKLGRLCIERQDRYPDIETWHAFLLKRGLTVKMYSYCERTTRAGTVGRLWIYYKKA
jgi:hypothetical protein